MKAGKVHTRPIGKNFTMQDFIDSAPPQLDGKVFSEMAIVGFNSDKEPIAITGVTGDKDMVSFMHFAFFSGIVALLSKTSPDALKRIKLSAESLIETCDGFLLELAKDKQSKYEN